MRGSWKQLADPNVDIFSYTYHKPFVLHTIFSPVASRNSSFQLSQIGVKPEEDEDVWYTLFDSRLNTVNSTFNR